MSVKVAVRVRPFNERETKTGDPSCCVRMSGEQTRLVDPITNHERAFTFDYSFQSHNGFKIDSDGISRAEDGSDYAD